jgi:hypothetical protein
VSLMFDFNKCKDIRNIFLMSMAVVIVSFSAAFIYVYWYVSPSLGYDLKVVYRWVSSHGGSAAIPGKDGWLFYRPALTWDLQNIQDRKHYQFNVSYFLSCY